MRIAIIEDIYAHALLISRFLQYQGAEVSCYTRWKDAMHEILKCDIPYDYLLLDLTLPEYDGLEILRDVKSEGRFPIEKVVIVTARCDKSTVDMAFKLGADGFIPKPVDLFKLKDMLQALHEEDSGKE